MDLKNKREGEIWKEGYEMGIRENLIAIEIGNAILDALDKRYKFQDEED